MWFLNRSDINRPVQSQKKARSLKFRIKVEEEMYYPSSENKGAGYRKADLRLCFRICRLLVFPWGGSYIEYNWKRNCNSWPRGYKTFFMLRSAETKVRSMLLINIEIPTIVAILAFMSRINYRIWCSYSENFNQF